ncbi:MAG: type II secretion system protein [Kiritimatiellia bacterium]
MTNYKIRQGFSLMELLIVMAILAILMAMVAPRAGNLIASSREHKCRNNLKQLHSAVMSFMNDKDSVNKERNDHLEGNLPYAMSYEVRAPELENPEYDWYYAERRGWIAWSPDKNPTPRTADTLNNLWKGKGRFEQHEPSLWHDLGTGALAKFGVENGTLFGYMNDSYEHYVCPVIRAAFKDADVWRTYAMNPFFHGPGSRSWYRRTSSRIGSAESYKGYTPEPSKLLLFVETLPGTQEPYQRKYDWSDPASDEPIYRGDCCMTPKDDELKTDNNEDLDYPPIGDADPKKATEFPYLHKVPRGSFGDTDTTYGIVGMAVFFDGHIGKILSGKINPVWAYNRGLDPSKKRK